jgi:hypothetical protein
MISTGARASASMPSSPALCTPRRGSRGCECQPSGGLTEAGGVVLGGGAQDSAHVRVFRPCCHDDIEATAKEHPGHQTVVYDRLRRAVELGGVHEMAGHPQPGLGQLGAPNAR